MPWDSTENAAPVGPTTGTSVDTDGHDEPVLAGTPVVVRRHAGVAALIGAAASAVAIAYLWRASQTMAVLDWTLCGLMAVIAAVYLAALVDARTPLLVADDLGVRIRLGDEWRGLPWEAIGQVAVHPRTGLLRDGRLVFAPRSLARALDGVDGRARRHVALNQKMYGAPLAVPLGFTTRVSGAEALVEQVASLALGRAEVIELDPRTLDVLDREAAVEPAEAAGSPDGLAGGVAPGVDNDPERTSRRDGGGPGETDPAGGSGTRRTVLGRIIGRGRTTHVGDTPDGDDMDRAVTDREDVDRDADARVDDDGAGHLDDLWGDTGWPDEGADDGTLDADGQQPGDADDEPAATETAEGRPGREGRRRIVGGIGTIVSRVAKGRSHDVDAGGAGPDEAADSPTMPLSPAATLDSPSAPSLLRDPRRGLRAEATLPTAGAAALDPNSDRAHRPEALPEGRELRRPGSVDLVVEPVALDPRVRPISTLGEVVDPIVIDDFVVEPAYDPVIGPEITAARTRLGLSVDELAERTRIRPHVIESIEVDDFAPCGGDFYARGHLRTLARILGKDVDPLLETFEERYASAPINARKVFEAELATGMTGSMRSTVGGPSWGLLVGVVLTLVLVWGVVRLFTTEPVEMVEMPAPILNSAGGVEGGVPTGPGVPAGPGAAPVAPAAADPVAVRLSASQSDTDVVVRDGDGTVVFSGELVLGERRTLQVAPPVRVRAADGGAVEIRVAGRDLGLLGTAGEPARRTFPATQEPSDQR